MHRRCFLVVTPRTIWLLIRVERKYAGGEPSLIVIFQSSRPSELSLLVDLESWL